LRGREPRLYNPQETERMRDLEGVELASFTSRAIAFLIDFVIAGVLFLAVLITTAKLLNRFTSLGQNNQHFNIELNFFENWYSIVYLVVFFGLSVYFGNGRTIGKRIMGIRVVSIVHHRMGLWHSIERALGYGASALEFGFGFVQYFIHPNRRTVHDRMAETIVIRDKRG
jgi:uncharacterized RDD family membrane protein YckC